MPKIRFRKGSLSFTLGSIFVLLLIPNTLLTLVGNMNLTKPNMIIPNLFQPKPSGSFNASANYEWWNLTWSFRFAIEVNSSSMARYWWQCDFSLNFTDILKKGNSSGSLDNRSIRVVEYNSSGLMAFYNSSLAGSLKYVVPSYFIMTKGYYNALTNATGILYFPLTNDTAKNTNRTYFIYFDTLEHGSKSNLYEPSWDKDYFGVTDAARDKKYRIASGEQSDTGGNTGREYIFVNGVSEWNAQVSGWSYDQISGNVVYDWNQDGKLEIGLLNYDSREMMFYTYVSPGVMTQFIPSAIYLSSSGPRSASIGDVDMDGAMELVIASENNAGITIYRYETTSPYFVLETQITTPSSYLDLGALAVYDLDKDGYPEIIGGTTSTATTTRLCIWEFNPATSTYDLLLNNQDTSRYQDSDILHCGDFDSDGNIEIISANSYSGGSQIYVWQCIGDNTYQYEMTFTSSLSNPLVGDVTDFDNDGRYELIISDGTDSTGTIRIFEYLGNGAINSTSERTISVDSTITPSKHPLIVDYDNDGSVELVMNGKDGRLAFFEFGTGVTTYSSDFGNYVGGPMGENFIVLGRRRNCDAYPKLQTKFYPLEFPYVNLLLTLRDNDNNAVIGAKASVINPLTGEIVVSSKFSDDTGQIFFTGILCNNTNSFNITIQLLSPNILFDQVVVYNKTIQITTSTTLVTIILDIWTINFIVTDNTNNPLSQGFVAIYNDSSRSSSQLINNVTLSQYGTCMFQWMNRSYYNYSISYFNPYYTIPFLVLTNNSAGISHTGNTTSTVQLQALITQVRITLIDSQSAPATGVKVSLFVNNTDLVAQLYTDGYGEVRDGQGQYFMNPLSSVIGNYTVRLTFYDNPKLFRNGSDLSDPPADSKNFTIEVGTQIVYQVSIDSSQYQLILRETELTSNFSLQFRGSAHFSIELNATSLEPGFEVNETVNASITIIEVRDFLTSQLVLSSALNCTSTGLYDFTLNASEMGIMAGKNYYATITITANGYGNQPSPLFYTFDVQSIPTSVSIENSLAQPISSVSAHWGQNFTVFISYQDIDWNVGIDEGSGSCWWDYGTYPLQPVTGQPGNYSVTVNSSDVDHVGTEILKFQVGKINYISFTDLPLIVKILDITTSLNSSLDFFESQNIHIYRTEAKNFTFQYFDEINHIGIDEALTQSYIWRKYDAYAQLLATGSGDLLNIGGGEYVLDFDTEFLNGSRYTFYISLVKLNYAPKSGFLSLDVNPIPLQALFSGNLVDSNYILTIPNKGTAEISVTLTDTIFNQIIEGASVTLEFEGMTQNFSEIGPGTYLLVFNTRDYNAYYADVSLLGKIKIQLANYTTITQDVKLTIKMDEMIPGIPTFYFILVIAFTFTVIGVPLFIKGVRYAKMPPFIKRANSIKNLIEKKKKVSVQKDVEYSMEYIIKNQFQDRWDLFKIGRIKKSPQRQPEAM